MSRRKRPHGEPTAHPQIEWLKHRTGYPSPEEREKIIQLRRELSTELIGAGAGGGKRAEGRIQSLIRKYGEKEVERAVEAFDETIHTILTFIAHDARSYREYRYRYGRFGKGLTFYSSSEIDELYESSLHSMKEADVLDGVSELDRLLLTGWREWEDITPPASPPRPDNYTAPQPGSYPAPIQEILEWGDELARSADFEDEVDRKLWKKHVPALTRMALDPGLLNGWPGEKASWAPWHASHALGTLNAWESAPALAQLADLENDWLSDHLPHIWADMGMEVEPSLWMILEDPSASEKKKGLVAEALQLLAKDNRAVELKVIKGFDRILKNTRTFNPKVNAYLIHFLNQMEVVDEIWETIQQAFAEERVDLDIITPEDLEADDWEDDEFDDDEE